MRSLVESEGNLSRSQWFQLIALTVGFQPDLVIELGRAYGNSTAAFAEGVDRVGHGRVYSVGHDAERGWDKRTRPRLQKYAGREWVDRVEAVHADITTVDFTAAVANASRVIVWWDAHGGELAEFVLREIVAKLVDKPNCIAMHDTSDVRYERTPPDYIRADGERTYWMAQFASPFEELVTLYDFASRNRIPLVTPQEAFDRMQRERPHMWSDVKEAFGGAGLSDVIASGGWVHFDVHGRDGLVAPPPRPEPQQVAAEASPAAAAAFRARSAVERARALFARRR